MLQLYHKDLEQTFSPFGLSDHFGLQQSSFSHSKGYSPKPQTRAWQVLGPTDWSVLDSAPDYGSKLQLFQHLVKIGLNTIIPLTTIKLHLNDAPWVSAEFKALIRSRQNAYVQSDTERFRHLRNITNRDRKLCRGKYYATVVANLKTTKPSQWWNEVKIMAGVAPAPLVAKTYARISTLTGSRSAPTLTLQI